MKVIVNYDVNFIVDIPEEKLLQARDNFSGYKLGGELAKLAEKYNPTIAPVLDLTDESALQGVYQMWANGDDPYTYILPSDNFDEVIWEDN